MFESLKALDRSLFLKINGTHSTFLDGMMYFISNSHLPIAIIILTTAIVLYRKFNLKKSVEFLVGCAIAFACTDLSTNVIKHQVKRYRPTHNIEIKEQVHTVNNYRGGTYGFFSAHAANNFSVITFIFFCVHWVKKKYRVLIFIYPLVVAYSRLYLGVHYPSDLFIGMISGLFFGWLVYRIMNKYFLQFEHEKV